jgi:hypothetical protein
MESGVRVIDQEGDKRAQGSMTESRGVYMHVWAFFWHCNPLFIHKIKTSYKLRTNRPYRTEKIG